MWIGTQDGLNRYDGYNLKIYRAGAGAHSSLSSSFITCMAEDESGVLWVGTNAGLNRYDAGLDRFIAYVPDSVDVGNNIIYSLCLDSKDNIWLLTGSQRCT